MNDLSFSVKQGEIFGFLGANGAGKSTTIRMLCGLLRPTAGTALVGGIDVSRDPEGVKRAHRLHVAEVLALRGADGRSEHPVLRRHLRPLGRAIRAAGASSCSRWPACNGRENTLTRELPGGWRQRLALGCAILHEPKIVFLDEPTGGVDPLSRRRFWDLIGDLSRQGVTVLVTTHYLDEAEHCHRIAIIQAGKLAALGTATELKQVFASTARSSRSTRRGRCEAMAILDSDPSVEKTSLFGTAVHAVLKNALDESGGAGGGARGRGHRGLVDRRGVAVARRRVPRRGRTGGSGVMQKDAGGRVEGAAADPARSATLLILLFVPAFFLLLYGYALNFDIRNVTLAVQDQDRSTKSRELVSSFVNSGYFSLVGYVDSPTELDRLVDRGPTCARSCRSRPASSATCRCGSRSRCR